MENILNTVAENLLTIIGFVFMITLIVTVHEGGHLIAAKIFNVYCSEFAIGMGPELFRKKNKETDFTIRLLPIGGYCSMAGETEDGIEKRYKIDVPEERTIKGVARWKQIIIYLAGVTMNFILGFIVIVIALTTISVKTAEVESVSDPLLAETVAVGDVFVQNENGIYTIERDGAEYTVELTEEQLSSVIFREENIDLGFAIESAPSVFSSFATSIIDGLKSLAGNPTQISGIVGIYSYTSEAVSGGWTVYLLLVALICINVGIFNLLPLPVMDGGRVVIAFIEMILGRNINKDFEKRIMLACAALLILLILWAFGLDIYRAVTGQLNF